MPTARAPFAELVQLSRLSVIDEWNVERGGAVLGCKRGVGGKCGHFN